jgi:hypothetical protein
MSALSRRVVICSMGSEDWQAPTSEAPAWVVWQRWTYVGEALARMPDSSCLDFMDMMLAPLVSCRCIRSCSDLGITGNAYE